MPNHAIRRAVLGAAGTSLFLLGMSLGATEPPKPVMLPTVPVIPDADFARRPTLGAPVLSPNGENMAVTVRVQENGTDKYQLAVLHVPDLRFMSRLDMAPHYLPIDITWVNDTRLVMGVGRETAFSEAPSPTGDIIAVDINGKEKRVLYSDRSRGSTGAMLNILKIPIGFGSITGGPDRANGHFYLTVNPAAEGGGSAAQAHKTQIFDIDAQTGAAKEIGSIDADGYRFVVHHGIARYAYGLDNNLREHVYFRNEQESPWVELPPGIVGKYFIPFFLSSDGRKLYSVGNVSGKPDDLSISDLDGTNREVLASNARADINGVFRGPSPRTPYAAVAFDGKPLIIYLDDSRYAKALKALNDQYPNHYVTFSDLSEDGHLAIVRAVSDRDPGTYALFDFRNNSLRPLYQSMPWMKEEQLGERRPFWFKSKSGEELGGFITFPPGRGVKNLPTVLLPHGGPLYVSNVWEMGGWEENEAQFLASRGYAVIQVNFRGSAGRGKNFSDLGMRQMGTGMLQDQLDALNWAIDKGYSDKTRVCIYGASYGGYAAYQQPIYAPPGTFRCAIAYAGISDIRIQAERSDTSRDRSGRNFLREAWGMDSPDYVKANSPIDHIDKFNVPLLIIHGEDDHRVPIQNAREMRDAMLKAGKSVVYMTKPKEGHGFFGEKNNVERFEAISSFLDEHLNPAKN